MAKGKCNPLFRFLIEFLIKYDSYYSQPDFSSFVIIYGECPNFLTRIYFPPNRSAYEHR